MTRRALSFLVVLPMIACAPSERAPAPREERAPTPATKTEPASEAPNDPPATPRADLGAPAPTPANSTTPETTPETTPTPDDDATTTARPPMRLDALYWARPYAARTTIDIIDLLPALPGRAPDDDPVMFLAERYSYPDGVDAALPADAPLPTGFALAEPWIIATAAGEQRGSAVAFGASAGASESHFIVVLDGPPVEGVAARADDWGGPAPTLRPATPQSLEGPGARWIELLTPRLHEAASARDRRVLSRRALRPDELAVVAGRFPRGFTHVAALARPLAKDDPTAGYIAGLLLTDKTGRVEIVDAPAERLSRRDIEHLVDLEGDDIDELVVREHYYEGSYHLALAWGAPGEPRWRRLTGDGA